jgi:hypothetical protein
MEAIVSRMLSPSSANEPPPEANLSETIFEDLGYDLRCKLGYIDSAKSRELNEIKLVAGG